MTTRAWEPEWPQLGDKVREIVSGYEGIVVGVTYYLWGCQQVLVSRPKKDEARPEAEWFDLTRVEVKKRAALEVVTHAAESPRAKDPSGADRPAPIR